MLESDTPSILNHTIPNYSPRRPFPAPLYEKRKKEKFPETTLFSHHLAISLSPSIPILRITATERPCGARRFAEQERDEFLLKVAEPGMRRAHGCSPVKLFAADVCACVALSTYIGVRARYTVIHSLQRQPGVSPVLAIGAR